jgi:Pre-toxin TG
MGCVGGPGFTDGCAFATTCGEEQAHRRKMRALQQRRDVFSSTKEPTEDWVGDGDARVRYLEFIRDSTEQLEHSQKTEVEKRLERATLQELRSWTEQQSDATLRRRMPVEVYVDLKVARQHREREAAEHQEAVDAKLEEFFDWAERRWAEATQERVRLIAPRHLLTEHPLRTQSLDALTGAVLDWALTHSQDPDFVLRSPSEVALYLLARHSALATAIELGKTASPHLDYTPLPDTSPPPEELVTELLGGLLPVIGEVTDAAGLVFGYSVTGRELDANERLLCGVAVLVPFVSGQVLAGAGKVERAALVTGRSLEEVRVLQRVATHLRPEEAAQVDRLMRQVSRGGHLAEEDVAFLKRVAAGLEKPLTEAAEILRRGGKVPLVGSRLGEAGIRLEPGSAEHMAAAWVDYQFRHPDKYPRFRFAIDEDWRKKYELIIKNKEAGGGFEVGVLKARGQEKNRALMMPPPGSEAQGFIPDAVPGSPTPGELVWGQPYDFIEVKGRKELSLGGNIEAMISYVREHGGSLELWVRSAKHPDGPTHLTKPLQRELDALERDGRAAIRYFPR